MQLHLPKYCIYLLLSHRIFFWQVTTHAWTTHHSHLSPLSVIKGCQHKRAGEKRTFFDHLIYPAHVHAKSLQLRPTLCDSMDCNPPGSSVHGDSLGKNTSAGCHALLQGVVLTQGSTLCLLCPLHWQVGSLPLAPRGNHFSSQISKFPVFSRLLSFLALWFFPLSGWSAIAHENELSQ